MIRRNVPLADDAEKWLLISQVEHARVSAELASAWRGGQVPEVVCAPAGANLHLQEIRRELLAAVLHHDDGWASWEASPSLDPETDRPYSFMELPRRESLLLWRDSILHARQIGPLAGWVVAGHFEQLLEDSDDAERELSEHWLAEIGGWRNAWLTEWRSLNRPVHTDVLAQECLGWLRLFDWLSLWLCCYCPARNGDERCEPMVLDEGTLASTPVQFAPMDASPVGERWTVSVAPWPFESRTVEVDALGYAVPAKRYATSGGLAKSRSPMRLRWRLLPTGEAATG
jgi:hypothetical protein